MVFNYTPDLSKYTILKTDEEQFEEFFISGHPNFLIPDFTPDIMDIDLGFLMYFEKTYGEPYDSDGSEVYEYGIVDEETGLTECKFVGKDYQLSKDYEAEDYEVEIEGYVVRDEQEDVVFFLATKVTLLNN